MEFPLDAAITALAEFIKEEVDEIKHVSREFPNPSYELNTPEISIISTAVTIKPSRNYVFAVPNTINSPTPILWHMGYLNFTLQLDLWTDNKEQRLDLAQQLVEALSPEIGRTSGLSLAMGEYYDTICRYETVASVIQDTDDSADRKEWRQRIDLLCHADVLSERKSGIMKEISLEQSELQAINGQKLLDLNLVVAD